MEVRYPCVRVRQDAEAKDLLLFSAPAEEIDNWVGIPQRLILEGNETETAGFQRTVSSVREAALLRFFSDNRNVIQNPLLGAIRQAPGVQVTFEPAPQDADLGHVKIAFEDLSDKTMLQLFTLARTYLEARVPALAARAMPTDIVVALQKRLTPALLGEGGGLEDIGEQDLDAPAGDDAGDDDSSGEEPAEEALFDESQITEFWDQLRAHELIAAKLPSEKIQDALLGFERLTLESYLRPVILVDGQHRLRGAVLATREKVDHSQVAAALIVEGATAAEARRQVGRQLGRWLPMSLLMDDSPAEHVFQYVVVNQKATAVPKALLGTIISTSLAADELDSIAERLEEAKIPLEGSRVISILSRAEDSPFAGKVAKGLDDEGSKLPWSVLGSLAGVFRFLQGGKYYHESKDHAARWRELHLKDSPIVADWQGLGYDSALDYWQSLDGPWIKVFKAFWAHTRDKLANTENNEAPNAWGNARDSNLFNKISLHILTADFFNFLREQRTPLDSVEQVPELVDAWLVYAAPNYFARNWKLDGVKKDSVGTRRKWSQLWVDHRQTGGSPPPIPEFSKLYKA